MVDDLLFVKTEAGQLISEIARSILVMLVV